MLQMTEVDIHRALTFYTKTKSENATISVSSGVEKELMQIGTSIVKKYVFIRYYKRVENYCKLPEIVKNCIWK